MKLKDLLINVDVEKIINENECDIKDLTIKSNEATKDSLYICIKGTNYDGHDFAYEAYKYGAVAIITEKKLSIPLCQIIVNNSRKALSVISSNFYKNPDKKLKMIAVLGTNGKTTTTNFITSILTYSGVNCGLIGTSGIFYKDKFINNNLTTPDPIDLFKILNDMYNDGVETVIMEVSAHAVFLDKVYGIDFELGVFTNLSQDHLDFFKNMENYANAKLKFFNENKCKYIVSNSDDDLGLKISLLKDNCITYGIENPADVFAIDIKEELGYSTFVINLFDKIYDVKLNIIGRFNVYNALASSCACSLYGISIDKVILGLENLKGVSGRLEEVSCKGCRIFIDYAHTPDGLEKTLKTLKSLCKEKLICVFGCGGNRDKKKRSIMGEISGKIADFTILTSDNPRFEEPMDIIFDIEKGIIKYTKNYLIIQDRFEATKYAINMAKKGDVVLIAGKGCEKYQEVFGIKHMYNDKDSIEEILSDCE